MLKRFYSAAALTLLFSLFVDCNDNVYFNLKRPHFEGGNSSLVLVINVNISLSSYVDTSVRDICAMYGIDKFYEDQTRCKSLMTSSIYYERIKAVNQFIGNNTHQHSHKESIIDASLLSLSTFLGSLLSPESENSPQNVCIVGPVSIPILLQYLIAYSRFRFLIITDSSSDSYVGRDKYTVAMMNILKGRFNDRLITTMTTNEFLAFRHMGVCDIIHARTPLEAYPQLLLALESLSASSAACIPSRLTPKLVLLEHDTTLPTFVNVSEYLPAKGSFYERIAWHGFSIAPSASELNLMVDSQGFTNALYNSILDFADISVISVGLFRSSHDAAASSSVCDSCPLNLHIVITYSSRLFQDNAQGLLEALERMAYTDSGREVVISAEIGGVSPFTARVQARLATGRVDEKVLQIAFGCHSPAVYLPNYMCYQSEQPWSYILSMNANRHSFVSGSVMRNSLAVLAMSQMQRDRLLQLGVPRVELAPFYPSASHPSPVDASYRYDVLLYGACSVKRKVLVHSLEEWAAQAGRVVRVICVSSWTDAVFDKELDDEIRASRLILNNHANDGSSLQTHRLLHLFALNKCVVSERSTIDPDLDALYEDAVRFGESNEDLIAQVDLLLGDPERLRACEEGAARMLRSTLADYTGLQAALTSAIPLLR